MGTAAAHPKGPIEHYIRLRDNSTYYLGTAVTAPEIEGEKLEIQYMNDLGGRSVPTDAVQDGEEHLVLTTLNRFNYTNYKRIRALNPGGLGLTGPVDRGLLMFGRYDFELILVYTYGGQVQFGIQPDMPVARRYYSSRLLKFKESTAGTRVEEIALAIRCSNLFNPATRSFGLFTEDPSQIGTLPPAE